MMAARAIGSEIKIEFEFEFEDTEFEFEFEFEFDNRLAAESAFAVTYSCSMVSSPSSGCGDNWDAIPDACSSPTTWRTPRTTAIRDLRSAIYRLQADEEGSHRGPSQAVAPKSRPQRSRSRTGW
jgi:hypothetical protein